MSIRLRLILLVSVSSLLFLPFGAAAWGIRSLGMGLSAASGQKPANPLTTPQESTYESP